MKHSNDSLDALADALLKADTPAPRAGFADSVLAAAKLARAEEKRLDELADKLLSKRRDFADVSDAVLSRAARIRRGIYSTILSCAAAAAVVAVSAISVILATADASKPKGVVTQDEFAEMSKIDDEINALTLLVMQGEILDLVNPSAR